MAEKRPGCGIVMIVAACIVGLFNLLIVAAMVMGALEGDSDVLLGGLVLIIPGALIVFGLVKGGLWFYRGGSSSVTPVNELPIAVPTAASQPEPSEQPSDRIVSITTIAGDAPDEYEVVPAAPAPAVAPMPAPAPAPAVAPAPAPAPAPQAPSRTGLYAPEASSAYSFEKAVMRSSDVFATLKDFAAHPQADPYDTHLASMLNAIGIATWADAPKVEAVKLGRSDTFWLGTNTDDLSDEALDRYLGVECALNVSQAMRLAQCSAHDVLRGVIDLEPLPSRRELPGIAEGAREQGEWMCRLRFAESVENTRAPFRMSFGMQANVAVGLFVVDLTIPRPDTMGFFALNKTGRIVAARAYALRSALLCARNAFDLGPAITRVVVNCGVTRGSDTLLSLDLDRAALGRLLPAAHDPAIDSTGFPVDPSLRVSFDSEGWFQPVEAFLAIDDPTVAPRGRYDAVELDGRPTSDSLMRACGAQTVSEMGINEHAGRYDAWERFSEDMGETTGEAVSRLVAIRNGAQDVSVAEAADRVSKALVEGTVDVSDKDALGKLFCEGGALDTVAHTAQEALEDAENANLEEVLSKLEEALSPIMTMGAYLDDNTQVYRYFNSLIERAWFNINLMDRSRAVRLVPDSYYTALSSSARILSMLDRGEEALTYTDELIRIAPATPDAALVRVRVLENMSRVYDATDLLKETISRCSTTRDMAICYYRLAYMEWKLGRSDLAVACYEFAISLGTPVVAQAEEELQDLLGSDSELKRLSREETIAALQTAGIPVGNPDALRAAAARAAIATTDAGLHSIAAPLTGSLIDMGRDDVLVDLYHSLRLGI